MTNIQEFNSRFANNEVCLKWLFKERFGTPKCPKCGQVDKYHLQSKTSRFICSCGGHQLSPKKDTIFENSDTDLYKWFYALYLFSMSKNGVSAKELQRQLKVTYKCAWRIGHQIRLLFEEYNISLSGIVEADETYVGGKGGKRGRSTEKKTAVFGMVERQGKVKAQVVKNVKTVTIMDQIQTNIQKNSTIMTDEFVVYNRVKKLGYKHLKVRHGNREYVRGAVHTNTAEGFWSQLKRSINGTYHAVSPKHLQTYVNEFSYRYNHRKNDEIFGSLMARAVRRV